MTCNFGTLAPSGQAVAGFAVCPTEAGTATNNATVESNAVDPIPTNNADTQTTEVTEPERCPAAAASPTSHRTAPAVTVEAMAAVTEAAATVTAEATEAVQEIEQEAESGDIEISNEITG